MKKGLLITGLVFTLLLTLIISVNYFILAKNSSFSSHTINMRIDRVYNRFIDTKRALEAAKEDALASTEEGVTCEAYLNYVLNSPLLDLDGVRVTGQATGCTAIFMVEADDESVFKKGTFP